MESVNDILAIYPEAKPQFFRKGTIIQQAGNATGAILYVKKGLLRSYIIDSKGKEHIYMFAPEGWIIGDVEAMEYNQPVELYIDCLEDTEALPVGKERMFKGNLSNEQLERNAQLLYRRIGRLQRRVLMLMGAPAIDRYEYFVKTYPDFTNRVPQHMIASFLGIAPQTLSTLKNRQTDISS